MQFLLETGKIIEWKVETLKKINYKSMYTYIRYMHLLHLNYN